MRLGSNGIASSRGQHNQGSNGNKKRANDRRMGKRILGRYVLQNAPTDILCNQVKPLSRKERLEKLFSLLVGNRDGRALSPELQDIITEKNQVFVVEESELTQTSLVAHDIDTGDTRRIRQRKRPVPIGARD
ncbi:unnamed protein product [Haemonchus placei]|uniref:DUF5681 domain-containing protein n=1 Tax=Haemonchus placei TaxID=6290 RepID=A0A0N4VYV9_HAEPC|nr:unnamed protein product [Haemonchus placei]